WDVPKAAAGCASFDGAVAGCGLNHSSLGHLGAGFVIGLLDAAHEGQHQNDVAQPHLFALLFHRQTLQVKTLGMGQVFTEDATQL
ncbi:MAG: hypothetical protein KGI86_14395, partial [Betaproteobacteria bacterium]|nr:hypothetical protein [Betaproteobacteria bacterium]